MKKDFLVCIFFENSIISLNHPYRNWTTVHKERWPYEKLWKSWIYGEMVLSLYWQVTPIPIKKNYNYLKIGVICLIRYVLTKSRQLNLACYPTVCIFTNPLLKRCEFCEFCWFSKLDFYSWTWSFFNFLSLDMTKIVEFLFRREK